MRILVIDDERRNILSATKTLEGHEVVTCDNIQDAYGILEDRELKFDAVLTDLFMPVGRFRGAMRADEFPRPTGGIPAGLVFAIRAANRSIRTVICTDADHHSDWICTLLDLADNGTWGRRAEPGSRVAYVEARIASSGQDESGALIKDWGKAMLYSGLYPELGSSEPQF